MLGLKKLIGASGWWRHQMTKMTRFLMGGGGGGGCSVFHIKNLALNIY